MAIEKAMNLLRSFGDINPTLAQCRQYFESMMTFAMNQGGGLGAPSDTDFTTTYGLRYVTDASQYQPQPPNFRSPGLPTIPQRPRGNSRVRGMADCQARNFGGMFPAPDQIMADYPAELFSDATFGSFNFGALDPIIQMS
jgi:hypothetical protein